MAGAAAPHCSIAGEPWSSSSLATPNHSSSMSVVGSTSKVRRCHRSCREGLVNELAGDDRGRDVEGRLAVWLMSVVALLARPRSEWHVVTGMHSFLVWNKGRTSSSGSPVTLGIRMTPPGTTRRDARVSPLILTLRWTTKRLGC